MSPKNITEAFAPEIFVEHIFKYLNLEDIKSVGATCKKWKDFASSFYHLEKLRCMKY